MDCAVYARQSVEKPGSLSIEGQIDSCRLAAGQTLRIYKDCGYSGKNTNRPDFQRLMADIRQHRIEKLYVYRLDRFSRSVADFGRLWDVLQKNRVEFVSVSENFDTSTPMGRAMLHIIMVFAQLERETTGERVRDNYYKRAGLGAWPGGPPPYGYRIGRSPDARGRPLSTLIPVPEQAVSVQSIFTAYAEKGSTLGSVAKELNADGIPGPRRKTWDSAALSRILHSPVYVRADEQVRLYYQGLGTEVLSPGAAFDGRHGLLLVGRRNRTKKQYAGPGEQRVSVLNSEGIVEPELWLDCQNKLRQNRQIGNAGKGTYTWLSGLLKCGCCGYSLKVSRSRSGRYLNCSGRYNHAGCDARIHVDLTRLEDAAAEQIQSFLDRTADPDGPDILSSGDDSRLKALERRAQRLMSAFSESTEMTASYLLQALERLEAERNAVLDDIRRKRRRAGQAEAIVFSRLSFDEKKAAAHIYIHRILVFGEDAEIQWNV